MCGQQLWILSGTSSSIRTKLWWNSHLMVLFQNCVRQSCSPTKMAAAVQLHCYWKQLSVRWHLADVWTTIMVYCRVCGYWVNDHIIVNNAVTKDQRLPGACNHLILIRRKTWPPMAIFVSDWLKIYKYSLTYRSKWFGRRTLTHDKSSHGLWPGELIKTRGLLETESLTRLFM
jgi:hypothetical protein